MTNLATDRASIHAALLRLVDVARSDTGQARRVANFLLAWWNGPELGHFEIAGLFALDASLAMDIASVITFLAGSPAGIYADAFGLRDEMVELAVRWRDIDASQAA